MELKLRIWRQLLVVSLALNLGFVYRDYSNGKHKHDLSCENECKNSCSGFVERADFEAKSSASDDEIIDVDLLIPAQSHNPFHSGTRSVHSYLPLGHSLSVQPLGTDDLSSPPQPQASQRLRGDPTMYEKYWQQMGGKATVVIPGWRFMSYVSDVKNTCFFLEPEFANAVVRLHKLVGNAVTQDRFIVVGTGSTQLIQAVLYATSPRNSSEPVSVVSAAPYYSAYPFFANYLKSGLYQWGGDAREFKGNGPYTEIVTSPNNPDGSLREAVVSSKQAGILIHDLAYYWPQYTSISSPADHEIMLFTVSKCTGHAGTRLGWALVKDEEIAKKMAEFMVINSAGVSKDSQLRGAKILQVVVDSHEHNRSSGSSTKLDVEHNAFFEHSYNLMAKRWRSLSSAVNRGKIFSLPRFPAGKCAFSGRTFATQPAFAWVKCEGEIDDCERFLRENYKILSKGGKQFGESPKNARISIMPRDHVFEKLVHRLSSFHS